MQVSKTKLDVIAEEIKGCTACPLASGRTNTVPGSGNPDARVVFFGEGPGAEEDQQGLPFVGRAGKLLTNIIASINLTREDVYIMNAVKCRPPGNRKPLPEEIESCRHFFQEQLEVIKPEVIVALGATAIEALCGRGLGITKRRGKLEKYQNIPVLPTFHPAYLLRNPLAKSDAWSDLQIAKKLLEEKCSIESQSQAQTTP